MAFRKVFGSPLQAFRCEQVLTHSRNMSSKCLNTVLLLGRAGKAPIQVGDTRMVYFPFVTEELRRKDDTMVKSATWHKIIVSNNFLVEKVVPNIVTGHRLYLEGSLYYRTTNTGEKSSFILARQVILLAKPMRSSKQNEDENEDQHLNEDQHVGTEEILPDNLEASVHKRVE